MAANGRAFRRGPEGNSLALQILEQGSFARPKGRMKDAAGRGSLKPCSKVLAGAESACHSGQTDLIWRWPSSIYYVPLTRFWIAAFAMLLGFLGRLI